VKLLFVISLLFVSLQASASAPTCFMPGDWPVDGGSCFDNEGYIALMQDDSFNQVHCEQWLGGTWYPNSSNCDGRGTMNPFGP
jgi:hypothetical protein